MKKNFKVSIVILLLATLLCVIFLGCEREEEQQGESFTLTFVTGFENDVDDPVSVQPITVYANKEVSMPDDPIKIGYEFLGWFYDEELTQPFVAGEASTSLTFYAKWEKKRADASEGETNGQTTAPSGVVYKINGETLTVVGYSGEAEYLTLSSSYEGKTVVGIAKDAFSGNATIKTITIPSTITNIEERAFYGATKLSGIEVSGYNDTYSSDDGVVYASDGTEIVVVGQGRSESLTLKNRVAKIDGYAFAGGTYDVIFGDNSSLSVISEYAFANYDGKVVIFNNVKEIRQRAFYDATCEISFATDCQITALAMGEFDGYKGKKLVLPSTISSISGSPFFGATCEIDFSYTGIRNLGNSAFSGYDGEKLVIPYFVESLGEHCFYQCTAEIKFAENTVLSAVGKYAFNDFRGEVYLPDTVSLVEEYAFYSMRYGKAYFDSAKESLTIQENAFYLCDINNVVFG